MEKRGLKGVYMRTFEEIFEEIITAEYYSGGTGAEKPPDWFMEDYLENIIRGLIKQVKKENGQ